ncbi:hypothetical protein JTB14_016931 [Gonioctena quinquepunctata]|nr:hypothetical protein JTB14_016931 [Gonioctena quinquepunctata]
MSITAETIFTRPASQFALALKEEAPPCVARNSSQPSMDAGRRRTNRSRGPEQHPPADAANRTILRSGTGDGPAGCEARLIHRDVEMLPMRLCLCARRADDCCCGWVACVCRRTEIQGCLSSWGNVITLTE